LAFIKAAWNIAGDLHPNLALASVGSDDASHGDKFLGNGAGR
jgi:hypothetical protein